MTNESRGDPRKDFILRRGEPLEGDFYCDAIKKGVKRPGGQGRGRVTAGAGPPQPEKQ